MMRGQIRLTDFCDANDFCQRTMLRWLSKGLFPCHKASLTEHRVSAWLITKQTAIGLMTFVLADRQRAVLPRRKKKDLTAAFTKILHSGVLRSSTNPEFQLYPDGLVLAVDGVILAVTSSGRCETYHPTVVGLPVLKAKLSMLYDKSGVSICPDCFGQVPVGGSCGCVART